MTVQFDSPIQVHFLRTRDTLPIRTKNDATPHRRFFNMMGIQLCYMFMSVTTKTDSYCIDSEGVKQCPWTEECKSFKMFKVIMCRSQWPRGIRRRSGAARLLRLWVRIPPGPWTFVCCECCVLSGRDLCDGQTPPPEEFYRMWCVVECDLETS